MTIKFSSQVAEAGSVEIFSSVGQKVFAKKTVVFDGMKLNLPELSSGIYWIRIGDESNKIMAR